MHMFPIMPSISKVKAIFFTIPPLLPSHLSKTPKFLLPQTIHTTSPLSLQNPFLHLTKPFSSLRSSSTVDGSDSPMETVRSVAAGEIHVIVGPMFAGKTTALVHRIRSDIDNGRRVAIIKSNKDSRYELDSIVTHDGEKMSCWALPNLSSFREKIGVDDYEKLEVIAIDEAQFFEDLYDFCRKAADHDGKIVVVAGLDGDYLRRSFGSVLDIIPLADSVTKLMSRCELCGKRAFFTLRKTEDKQTELIGGADVYMPVCRQHYVNGQVVIEAARNVLESQKIQCDSYLEAAPLSS